MRIFVTGGTGFIGRNLVKALRLLNYKIYLYRRGEDINVVKKFNPDIIYHLAAELKNEKEMVYSNFYLTKNLLDALEEIEYKTLIYPGTSSEYGKQDMPMKETDVCGPTTIYGGIKLMTSSYIIMHGLDNRKNNIILRPFSVYGFGEPQDRFIPKAIKCCLEGRILDLWEGNHDWVNVDDVVNAFLHFSNKRLPGIVINIGTGIQTSNEEVVKLIEKIIGKKMKIKKHEGLYRKEDSYYWVADISRALSFGWKPTISLEEGLRRMIDEIRES